MKKVQEYINGIYIYIYGVFNICWDPYFGKSANNVYLSIYYIIYDFNVFRK